LESNELGKLEGTAPRFPEKKRVPHKYTRIHVKEGFYFAIVSQKVRNTNLK